ncbi:MAG TPA: TIGR03546 family protein [Gemmatimonadales bacterium]|nr:TIGR03546 family protein [Gemmatimonadales bacterium]
MLALLKLLQSIFKTLHSEGTPGQVAAGLVLGAGIGLTPLLSAHNLVLFAALALLNVSFGGGLLGIALFTPLGFALDPLFDRIGLDLLHAPGLVGLWTSWYNTPLVPYTGFNNSVTLGSFVTWVVLAVPLYFLGRRGVTWYRANLAERVINSGLGKAVRASVLFNIYRWFRPE